MASHSERHYVLSRFQKTIYGNRGKDVCRWCSRELHEGDHVIRKYGGSSCSLYHTECYAKKVITIG